MKTSIYQDKKYTLIATIALIVIWKVISALVGAEIKFPSPERTAVVLFNMITQHNFWLVILATIGRTLLSFTIAFFTATIAGMLAGFYRPIEYLFKPLVNVLKTTPTLSIIVIVLVWLGSQRAPILIGFLITFPVIYTNVLEGLRNVDTGLVQMATMYQVGTIKIVKDIYLPSIMPYLMAGASSALGLSVKIIVAAEYISGTSNSLGDWLYLEKAYLNTAGMFAVTLIALAIAAILEGALRQLQQHLEKWKG